MLCSWSCWRMARVQVCIIRHHLKDHWWRDPSKEFIHPSETRSGFQGRKITVFHMQEQSAMPVLSTKLTKIQNHLWKSNQLSSKSNYFQPVCNGWSSGVPWEFEEGNFGDLSPLSASWCALSKVKQLIVCLEQFQCLVSVPWGTVWKSLLKKSCWSFFKIHPLSVSYFEGLCSLLGLGSDSFVIVLFLASNMHVPSSKLSTVEVQSSTICREPHYSMHASPPYQEQVESMSKSELM